jgi:hypothetical protein
MKTKTQLLITSLMVASFFVQSAEAQSVLAEGAKLELLSRGFSFTEGPTCDSKGNVYFTDQNLDRILKWSTDGILTVFMSPSGRANGMFMDAQDHLIACADEKNELWRISLDGKKEVLMKGESANEKLSTAPMMFGFNPMATTISLILFTKDRGGETAPVKKWTDSMFTAWGPGKTSSPHASRTI